MTWLALIALARGAEIHEGERLTLDLGGSVKAFTLLGFPYDSPLMPEAPWGSSITDGRLELELGLFGRVRFSAHHAITAFTPAPGVGGGLISAGAGLVAPEALPLTWEHPGEGAEALLIRGRTDRLLLSLRLPHVDLTLGRQPVSFGVGRVFTPLDLINPFSPAVIDSSNKPGVDAVRLDLTLGVSTRVTAVAALAGDTPAEDMVYALMGQGTLGVWDLGLFLGHVRRDQVLGLSFVGALGPVGVHGEGSVTRPDPQLDEAPFVRATLGAEGVPHARVSLGGELYLQTSGSADPADLLDFYASERALRGELWTPGRLYLATYGGFEITPLVRSGLALIANLDDPSALVAPSLTWSVAEDAELSLGGYLGLGRRPAEVSLEELASEGEQALARSLRSEYGLIPTTAWLRFGTWF